jgi:chromosome segregation protein
MHQIELVLSEVKRSYDTLRIQSEKTLKFRTLRDEIFNCELDIQLLRLKQFRYEKDERNETLRRRTEDRDRIREEMEAESKALEAHMDEVNSMEAHLVEMQKNIYGLALEKNAKENTVRLLNEQLSEGKIKIEQNETREKQVNYKIEELNEDASNQDKAALDLQKQAASVEENIRSFEENIRLAATRIEDNEKAVQKADSEIHDLEKEQAVFEKHLAQITDDIVAELDAGLKKAGYSATERRNVEAALNEVLGKLRTVLVGREAIIRDLAAVAKSAPDDTPIPIGTAELLRITEGLATELADAATNAEKAIAQFESYRSN